MDLDLNEAVEEMYRLTGDAFDTRWNIMAGNIRRSLFDDFIQPSDTLPTDPNERLRSLVDSLTLIAGLAGDFASITQEQKQDLRSRVQACLNPAASLILRNFTTYGSVTVAFQRETASQLGIPIT